ncbi:hypothetical protein OS493_022046 [Desmophyllum pertusum]|uniref:Uncharacterized protein n=1 Tax=Desmophyllum pertusum TaxID=174260 RepID=A0A9W9YYV5_9CNID|nr:hypothetical protein OS493_022046 [Desmophyllum pertusum]
MPPNLQKQLWQLDVNTPFPDELKIYYEPQSKHGLIAPTIKVKRQKFEKMLKCLHWKRLPIQGDAMQGGSQERPYRGGDAMQGGSQGRRRGDSREHRGDSKGPQFRGR